MSSQMSRHDDSRSNPINRPTPCALCACVGDDEKELSFDPGAVITGVRPAAWLAAGWPGLREDVEYLRGHLMETRRKG